MQCKLCHRDMASSDPIYRVSLAYEARERTRCGGAIAEVCAECCATTPPDIAGEPRLKMSWLVNRDWRPATPCERCARPVIGDMRRKLPKHVACGPECRGAIYGALEAARRRRPMKAVSCLLCGVSFLSKRNDARYCGSACKQKAFRGRSRRLEAL